VILSKLYFFIYAVIGLIVMALVYLIVSRKIVWSKDVMMNGLLLFVVASALSIVIMSPNKMQSLFLPYGGFVTILAFVIYYLFLINSVRDNAKSYLYYIGLSGFIASIVSVLMYVQPFRALELPAAIAFLKNPFFNTVGSQVDLLIFLGFSIVAMVAYFMSGKNVEVVHTAGHHGHTQTQDKNKVFFYVFLAVTGIAVALQLFEVAKSLFVDGQGLVLTPFTTSWYAAIEVLKNPFTALFGVGVGNFAALFTQVKQAGYNITDLWQISSFNVSRSGLLHILTEMGIVGVMGLGFVLYNVFENSKNATRAAVLMIAYAVAMFVLFPPSFITYFVLFVALAFFSVNTAKTADTYVADLGRILPIFVTSVVLFGVFILGLAFFTSTAFASEVIFKQALDAIGRNDVRNLYELQRRAILVNPYNEDFRKSFSQTNMIIANNLAGQEASEIDDRDRQTITQAIQAGIAEGKAAVALNPQKVSNWQYLASVYRNIINVAQGAELWTIAAYQRAILLDPQNPVYRLELGGVYYLLQNYDESQKLFEQAVTLKPDWANAHYNLAWTLYRKENYIGAVQQMEAVLTLLDQKESKADYDQAKKDLEEFKKKVPTQGQGATPSAQQGQQGANGQEDNSLLLPTPPAASIEPELQLPQDSSPGAGLQQTAPFGGVGQ
jgi:tetratricopeptide (TPR) repeat protein